MANGIEPTLEECIGLYEDYLDATDTARNLAERDRDYVDHKQWTADEVRVLKDRNQPCITINRIKPKVEFLKGLEKRGRTDIKAFPRTPLHEDDAESATDALRYVADNTDYDSVKSDAFDNLIVEGVEAGEVVAVNNRGQMEVDIRHVRWDRLYYDVHSVMPNFEDSKGNGIVIWMDKEDAISRWPDKENEIENAFTTSNDETFEDKPHDWIDRKNDRIKVCQCYIQKRNMWWLAFHTGTDFLQGPMESPWLDEDRIPENGMVLQSIHMDREGNRYGPIRQFIDPQDEVNQRRSKALHILNSRQVRAEVGTFDDPAEARRQLTRPDGYIESNPGKQWDILDTADLAAGQLGLLQEAKGEIDTMGANESLTGRNQQDISGRSVQFQQAGGQVELTPIFDAHRNWSLRIYRKVWNRIRQFWTGERWIRVTDDPKNMRWVNVNRPVTLGEQILRENNVPEEALGDPQVQQSIFGSAILDPRLQTVVGIDNSLAEIDVDLKLEEVPDAITLQTEQFEQLVQMYQANPQGIPWEMVIQASQLRNKDELLETFKPNPEAQQAQMQEQQRIAALQEAAIGAEVKKDEADAFKKTMEGFETQLDTQQKAVGIQ